MRANEYVKLAMKTANTDLTKQLKLTNAALGLTGESGEVADHVKKYIMQGHELNEEEVKKELGDIMWYIALACDTLGIELEDVMQANIDKLKKRYGDKFSVEASKFRKEV